MSLNYRVEEFFESSGNAAAVFNENLRDGIINFSCNLWSQFPGWLTEGSQPLSSFARGFMNQMCSPVQPAVPIPSSPFQGGQCSGVNYNVIYTFEYESNFNPGVPVSVNQQPFTLIDGAITELSATQINARQFQYNATFADGTETAQVIGGMTPINTTILPTGRFWTIVRPDGLPDNCGNPNEDYGSPMPLTNDLKTIITVTNLDGTDNNYDLVYNQINNNYNFPMGFKLGGTNVTLDLSGLTIHGAPQVTAPTSGNDVPPPGSDGGDNGIGDNNDTLYPEVGYPVLPELVTQTTAEETIEYLVCTAGVISTVSELLKLAPGTSPWLNLIVDLIDAITTELCDMGTSEAIVGLPEYYGLRPGVERPAIVYLYKEYINGTWDASTYSSTVNNPSPAAVAAINTVVVPDKTMGIWVTSLNLTDGSRIKASGDTTTESQSVFNFLLNQVDPAFIPADVPGSTVVSSYPALQTKTVKCRQIEYYPNGKQAGVSPSIRRVIPA